MRRRVAAVIALVGGVLLLAAAPAVADPALPSNYVSQVLEEPSGVDLEVRGGDSFLVLDVPSGTDVLVPGYTSEDQDFDDWPALEEYLRVLPDGTVQLNRRSAAYYTNEARFGASPEGIVGPDVPPDWETVASDGRIAWHDHRIHWMSPVPPGRIDPAAGVRQDVLDYRVPVVIGGELAVATGDLDWVPDPAPWPVVVALLVGAVGGFVLARRSLRWGALAALVTGGTVTVLLLATTWGRPAGFEVATPPIVLALVGAVAPLLGTLVPGVRTGQRRVLVVVGGTSLLVFGVLTTGLLDPLLGGGATGDGGFGNWWLRPTLPVDVLPDLLRMAIVAGTGVGAALVAAVAARSLEVPGGLDGLAEGDADGSVVSA